jgi:hypothetical protein
VKLNERAFEHANALIIDGRFVHDDRDGWSDHQPSAADENRFIEAHGIQEFGRWCLGVDNDEGEDTTGRYSASTGAVSWPRSHGRASGGTTTSSWRSPTGRLAGELAVRRR